MDEVTAQRRGWLLTIWLGLLLISNTWAAFVLIRTIIDLIGRNDPLFWRSLLQWVLPLMVVLTILNIGATIALWFWRRIGLYILAVATIIEMTIYLLGLPFVTAPLGLIGLVILWLFLRPRWQYFH